MAALKALSRARPSRTGPMTVAWTVLRVCSNAQGDVGEQLVDALHLRGGQRRGARGVVADGIEVPEQRLDVALELLGELRHAPGGAAGDDDDRDLRDGDGERGHRDDAQKDVTPRRHVVSRRACW